MVKRTCKNCGTDNYSADTITDVWICLECGAEIEREEIPFTDLPEE